MSRAKSAAPCRLASHVRLGELKQSTRPTSSRRDLPSMNQIAHATLNAPASSVLDPRRLLHDDLCASVSV
jgi:hypothetical protein